MLPSKVLTNLLTKLGLCNKNLSSCKWCQWTGNNVCIISFLPRDALVHSAVLRLHVVRLYVRLSVCNIGGSESESQCGFRSGRGTMDMIFTARQLQEKCREQQRELYVVFVDLTKAFDSVDRTALWEVLLKIGCPPGFVNIIRSFHDGMRAAVVENGEMSADLTLPMAPTRDASWHRSCS